MKLTRLLVALTVFTSLVSATAFAQPAASPKVHGATTLEIKGPKKVKNNETGHQDPVKRLEKIKDKVNKQRKDGEISPEQADELNRKLDEKFEKTKEFQRLPVDKKKDVLNENFKKAIEQKINDGKITREEADKLLKEFSEKVEKWDGNGYPQFAPRETHKKVQ